MKNSIEAIWKDGFLNEKSLVAPKINDLYNQKSRHLVDRVQRRFSVNFIIIVVTAITFPVVYYFLDFIWQGISASVLLLLYAWFYKREMQGIKTLDQGATSLDYLRSFDGWLQDVLSRTQKIARISYPLFFLIALSTMWSAWNKQEGFVLKTHQQFPDSVYIGDTPLFAIIIAAVATLIMILFSGKISMWEVRLMYGRVFDKLKETIAEMEKLKEG